MNIDKEYIKNEIVNNKGFVKAIFTNKTNKIPNDYEKVLIKPSINENSVDFQVDSFTKTQHFKKFISLGELNQFCMDLLEKYFDYIHIQTISYDLQFRISKKGKVFIKKGKPSCKEVPVCNTSNKVKSYPFMDGIHNPLLERIGIMDKNGNVLSSKYKKFKQINQFIKFITELELSKSNAKSIDTMLFVDCGCGKAYLTFSVFYYFRYIMNKNVYLIGIDNNAEVIEKCKETQKDLGYKNMEFHVSTINDFQLSSKPDIVFSLHACDNATDEAIAKAINWGADSIIAAPCCQHELHKKMQNPVFTPILRHGILRERMADLLTDSMRSLTLRIMGYKADILEFISPEYTSKNLIIRAKKKVNTGEQRYINQYITLKEFWGISNFAIENLIGDAIKKYL